MSLEPVGITILKRVSVAVCIVSAYLWVSTDEWEFEQEQQTIVYPQEPRVDTIDSVVSEPDDEVDTSQIAEPEQQFGWVVPPEPVRKSVARVKKKIKQTVKKGE